jgi:hypothetical protein
MTEDTEAETEANYSVSSGESRQKCDGHEWTRDCWESLPANPEDSSDLGYEIAEWEQFETLDNTDQVMFLPTDEEELKDAAFVVTDSTHLVDLKTHC